LPILFFIYRIFIRIVLQVSTFTHLLYLKIYHLSK